MLEKYLELVQLPYEDTYLFRTLTATKQGYKLRSVNQPLCYTRVRELIMDALKLIVSDVSKYCIHSLRSGGATKAARAGIEDRLFKMHGRWISESAKDGYVKEDFSKLLSVSQSVSLTLKSDCAHNLHVVRRPAQSKLLLNVYIIS